MSAMDERVVSASDSVVMLRAEDSCLSANVSQVICPHTRQLMTHNDSMQSSIFFKGGSVLPSVS